MNEQSEHDDEPVMPASETVSELAEMELSAGEVAGHAVESAAASEMDELEDDGPVELADPFEGDENAKPVEVADDEDAGKSPKDMQWFILKVQSNREDSIREALLRRI